MNYAVVGVSPVFVQKDSTPLLRFELVISRADVRRDAVIFLVLGCTEFSGRCSPCAQTVTADAILVNS